MKTYMIQPGDSLWNIALRTYGDGSLWPLLYSANVRGIVNPHLVFPGQTILIPE